ncbi:hypothetical protein [Sphingobacterium sp. BIGb0165]|uniref:hypothetical protein n=1 Tax=Sphingobacterium sp. BIGb0165 TaxID=2940615 RepID=UPI002167E8AB|nr:hypothetical protein [Sphingobacterium sp. BIGb0165]MCS4224292.1 hypothetical protein [Sphingobacterium sp. BIGb0165]
MNKFIVRIGVLSLFALLEINAAHAQSQEAEKVGLYITQEMSFLNMTTTQAEQVYQINLQAANAVEDLRQNSNAQQIGAAENIEGFTGILKQRNLAVQEILSPVQFQLFKENKIIRAATFRTIVMAKMLDLTQDQLDPIFDINQTVVKNVREDLDTYFSADNNSGKKNAQRRLHKALKKTDKAFDKALSPQQTTIYNENVDLLRNVLREEYGTKDSF